MPEEKAPGALAFVFVPAPTDEAFADAIPPASTEAAAAASAAAFAFASFAARRAAVALGTAVLVGTVTGRGRRRAWDDEEGGGDTTAAEEAEADADATPDPGNASEELVSSFGADAVDEEEAGASAAGGGGGGGGGVADSATLDCGAAGITMLSLLSSKSADEKVASREATGLRSGDDEVPRFPAPVFVGLSLPPLPLPSPPAGFPRGEPGTPRTGPKTALASSVKNSPPLASSKDAAVAK